MKNSSRLYISPEPGVMKFSGKWLKFGGFKNLPEFLRREFNLDSGAFLIEKVNRSGTGVEVLPGKTGSTRFLS